MKSDLEDVARLKSNTRRRVQAEIQKHLQDPDFRRDHNVLQACDILPVPRDMYVDVELDGEDSDHSDEDMGVAVHDSELGWMADIAVDDMVCLVFADEKDVQQIGVAQVLEIVEGDGPSGVKIHWWDTPTANSMYGAFAPVFGHSKITAMYRAMEKKDPNDSVWEDDMEDKYVIEYGDIFAPDMEPALGKKRKKKKPTGKLLRERVRQLVCGLEQVVWKMKKHGETCECMNNV